MKRLGLAVLVMFLAAQLVASSKGPETPPTYTVSGTVWGSGAPLAHAKIELRDGKKVLGSATADASGHFQLKASPGKGRQVTLHIEAPHFVAADWTETAEVHRDDLKFALDPVVDQEFVASVPANPDPESRLRDLRIVLTAPVIWDWERSYELVFSIIGRERADLRTLAQSAGDDEGSKDVRDRALALLALWGDPSDEPIYRPWESQNPEFTKDHPEISGATVDEVCEDWATAHFKQEKADPPYTYHGCFKPVMDPEGQHAFVTFFVRYAHWDYAMFLVLRKEGESWKLKRVLDAWIS